MSIREEAGVVKTILRRSAELKSAGASLLQGHAPALFVEKGAAAGFCGN
jgi:hypothetical protein